MISKLQTFTILTITVISFVIIAGCSSDEKKSESTQLSQSVAISEGKVMAGGGITWMVPSNWLVMPERPMRLQTYSISPIEGDSDSAECAVYYFGASQGGAIDANLKRWAGQFEQPDGKNSFEAAEITKIDIDKITITTIELNGIYLVPGGPMMQATDRKSSYKLLGAICEGPQGSVFFKLTGPEKTVSAAHSDFINMLKSVKPDIT